MKDEYDEKVRDASRTLEYAVTEDAWKAGVFPRERKRIAEGILYLLYEYFWKRHWLRFKITMSWWWVRTFK